MRAIEDALIHLILTKIHNTIKQKYVVKRTAINFLERSLVLEIVPTDRLLKILKQLGMDIHQEHRVVLTARPFCDGRNRIDISPGIDVRIEAEWCEWIDGIPVTLTLVVANKLPERDDTTTIYADEEEEEEEYEE